MNGEISDRLDFVRPDAPAPEAAAKYVFGEWENPAECARRAPDFSDTLFVLPTRAAARNFKRALSVKAVKAGLGGVLGLSALTQEELLERVVPSGKSANPFAVCCARKIALGKLAEADPNAARAIFGEKFPSEDDVFELSKRIGALKRTLAEGGLDFSEAAKRMAFSPDAARWEALAKLDAFYVDTLKLAGAQDSADMFLDGLKSPDLPFLGVKKIVLLFCPEVGFGLGKILEKFEAQGGTVRIAVLANSEFASRFDSFGTPKKTEPFDSDAVSESRLFSFPDISEQAEFVANTVAASGGNAGKIWSISCDEKSSSGAFSEAFAARKIACRSASGREISEFGFFKFFSETKNWLDAKRSFGFFMRIARNLVFLRAARKFSGKSADEIISCLDAFGAAHIPKTLECALKIGASENPSNAEISARQILKFAGGLFGLLSNSDTASALENFFDAVEPFFCAPEDGAQTQDASEKFSKKFREAISEFKTLKFRHGIDASTALGIILSGAFGAVENGRSTGHEVEMQDWIETFWSASPRIILADFNEGKVPQAQVSDPFLTDCARNALGLKDSAARRSRDAYMLHTLLYSRQNSDRGFDLKILCPRKDFGGENLFASGLLLDCRAELAAARVKKLFGEFPPQKAAPAFFSPWKFKVPFRPAPDVLSATKFKSYLKCPFRFYMRHVLKADVFTPPENAMDSAVFGSLFHSVMEDFAHSPAKDSVLGDEIFFFLKSDLKKRTDKIFGADIPAGVKIQLAGLESRLRACADAQGLHAAAGWRILDAEKTFKNIEIDGVKIVSKVDRIDALPDGTLLALDYKTIDASDVVSADNSAMHSHIKRDSKTGEITEWKDLQLPVYRRAVMGFYGAKKVSAAYFLCPKSVLETRIDIWEISDTEDAAAFKKAGDIISKIKAREFSPSQKNQPFDTYAEFFGFAGGELGKYLEFENA